MQVYAFRFQQTKNINFRPYLFPRIPKKFFSNENFEGSGHSQKSHPIPNKSLKERMIQNMKILNFMKKYFIPIGNPTSELISFKKIVHKFFRGNSNINFKNLRPAFAIETLFLRTPLIAKIWNKFSFLPSLDKLFSDLFCDLWII